MKNRSHFLTHGALLAALYAALCFLQELLVPGSASWVIQFRVAEALCVLSFFTPAAVPGLAVGCALFNWVSVGALPLDPVVGPIATFLAAGGMYLTRRWTLAGYPLVGMLLPAVCNALLIGWELAVSVGGGFWIHALYVSVGELTVLLSLGTALYYTLKKHRSRLFRV